MGDQIRRHPGHRSRPDRRPPELTGFLADRSKGIRGSSDLSKVIDWDRGQGNFDMLRSPRFLRPVYVELPTGRPRAGCRPTSPKSRTAPRHQDGGYIGGVGISPDFSHYFFSSINTAFTGDGLTAAPGSAYDNDLDDRRSDADLEYRTGRRHPGGRRRHANEYIEFPGVSTDGSHVLMSTDGGGGTKRLYMAVDATHHYDVSVGTDGLDHAVTYAGMTADGSTVYFTSAEQLSDDDTDTSADLYMWNEGSTGSGHAVDAAGDSDNCSASVDRRLRSQSHPHRGQIRQRDRLPGRRHLLPLAGAARRRQRHPRRAQPLPLLGARSSYIATLFGSANVDRIQVSPIGDHTAFVTSAALTPQPTGGHRVDVLLRPGEPQRSSASPASRTERSRPST